ncbi:hypothetical protein K457DRAFT_250046 [Linnemannia elongata AG-77]|uniref:Transmembrane protein 198 n=1 Tax=Linnemannia elongata AG-77 TaxID=1314771 RepID=A0A197K8P4_9FUNG|nr:hypothetical protein K457DRAFT_250046 [Linnemannia elongata AG-77]
MASSLHPTASTSSRSRKHQNARNQIRSQPTTTTIIHTFLFQLCFLICTTLLTLTTPTNAYPLLAYSDDSTDNTNTLVNEANASNTPSVGVNTTMEDTYGRLILDVGQKTVISTSNWVLGTILILVGLVQVFYGFKFIRLTLVLTGFLSWAVIAIMITVVLRWDLVYFLFKPSHAYFWIWFLAGILGAIFSFRYWDLGVAFAGGFGGFALAMGIIAAVNDSHNITNTPRYIILAVLILLGAAIAIFYERFSIILGTSLGGAFMVMFGVDEFLQAGYREMIVIFDFAGKTLQYHPDKTVFIMIGSSLALACLGIAWEFWHHAKPLLVDRKALFRIYGRPFGKRPHKLAGQRLKRKVAQSDWYSYLAGCLCLRRRTAEEVLYEDDEIYDEAANAANSAAAVAAGITTATTTSGQASGAENEKTGSTTSDSAALETVVIIVDETHSSEKPILLPGSEINYGSGIESPIPSSSSSSSSHSTLTTQTATGTGTETGPVEVVITESSESVDENGARIVTTTTTTTTTRSSGGEQHEQHYSSTESRTQHSEVTSSHQHQMASESNSSGHAEMMMRTESSSTSSSSQSAHMATTTTTATAARSMETSSTSASRTLLQSMAAAHHSSSSRTTTTTTTNESGTTTVVASHSSSSS